MGARAVLDEYDGQQQIAALPSKYGGIRLVIIRLNFKVPVRPEAVLKVLNREKERNYVCADFQ
jgi:hypothetical protein